MLSKLQPHFPLANLLACVGIVLTLSLEAMGRYVSEETEEALLVEKIPSNQSISQSLRLSKPSKDDLQEENQKLLLRDIEMPPSYQTIGEKDDVEQSSDKYKEELMKQRILYLAENSGKLGWYVTSDDMKDVMTVYAIEASTAVHSLIIGFNLGVLPQDQVDTITILFVALAFHQFVEGVGLGSVIKSSHRRLSVGKVVGLVLIFSSTISIGVVMGLLFRGSRESSVRLGLEGGVTALAAGSLMYVALVEMASVCFQRTEVDRDIMSKIKMLLMMMGGIASMAVIGIWG